MTTTFSIITPAWNVAPWLPAAIESVLDQKGDFLIEYIIVTDPSPDNTVAIAKMYAEKIRSGNYPIRCRGVEIRIIERSGGAGAGMYYALNDGFAQATGDIHAWIAGDDMYQPGAFETMRIVFENMPHVEWLKGISSSIDEDGNVIERGRCKIYHQSWLKAGVYGMEAYHVEQDSVFWRAPLWKKGDPFPATFRSMGDYWRWMSFAAHARLWSVNVRVSYFRKRSGQDSIVNAARCKQQMWEARGNKRPLRAWPPRLFFYPYYHVIPHRLRPFMERIYPIMFPHQSREYVEVENGVPIIRVMPSFIAKQSS